MPNIFGNLNNGNRLTVSTVKAALFGVAVGDALGVPVEFRSREYLSHNPINDMIGYGTYNQPPGTWSDDSSLSFCLAEVLTEDFDIYKLGKLFVKWYYENYWTPRGEVFDIGINTREAIIKIANGEKHYRTGGVEVSSNGNGALMRILPLLFYINDKPIDQRFELVKLVSSITHAHIRSVIACFYYLEFARQILQNKSKYKIFKNLQSEIPEFLNEIHISTTEINMFEKLLKQNINELPTEEISGSAYVLHTLEAGIFCLLTSESYEDAVLKAVNLGDDTDTTAAVTGGLAGLLYGFENIPVKWINQIARKKDIENLAIRVVNRLLKF